MDIWLKQFLVYISSTTVVVTAIAFFLKSIFQHFLDKSSEYSKINLQANIDLQKANIEFNQNKTLQEIALKTQAIQNKRIEVIEEFYDQFVGVIEIVIEYIVNYHDTGEIELELKYEAVTNEIDGLRKYFRRKRLYFGTNECNLIQSFFDELSKDVFAVNNVGKRQFDGKQESDLFFEIFKESWERIELTCIPKIRDSLENRFRKIIGINNE